METWREIVAEMREVSGDETVSEIVITKRDWLTLADRIETACKTLEDKICEFALPHGGCTAKNNYLAKVFRLEKENAKLRRALEPVMDVILGGSSLTDSYSAVQKAQAIMKEGEE